MVSRFCKDIITTQDRSPFCDVLKYEMNLKSEIIAQIYGRTKGHFVTTFLENCLTVFDGGFKNVYYI